MHPNNYGIGAVLSHVFANRCERPIAYASRTLSKAEQQYAQINKEALGLIFGVQRFIWQEVCFGHRP